jgi:tRNA dimethylallyltransferase
MTPKFIVLTGPTGVGKSELALSLAEAIDGEIVSVDSRQIYVGMDIGTAKPSPAEQARVVHHLLDLISPRQTFSAGQWAAAARTVVEEATGRGRPVLLVGGSGLYLSALLDGLFDESVGDRESRRRYREQRLLEGDLDSLWLELGERDPAAQRSLSPTDGVRVLRALELSGQGGRASRWQHHRQQSLPGLGPMICLSRPREELYDRIDRRTEGMVQAGWLEEIRTLLAAGAQITDPGLVSLGYTQLIDHLRGGVPLDEAVETIRQKTRQYAKRQITWFRRDRRFRWLDLARYGTEGAQERILLQYEALQS